jgi:hypothetical protein
VWSGSSVVSASVREVGDRGSIPTSAATFFSSLQLKTRQEKILGIWEIRIR